MAALFKHKTVADSTQNHLWHGTKPIKWEIPGLCFVWLYKQSLHLLCQHHKEVWAMKSSVKRARLWGNIHFLPFFCLAPLFAPCALLFFPLYHPRSHSVSLLSLSVISHPLSSPPRSYFFLLSLDLRLGARTQTWHTYEQSIPLLNNTSFISSGLFSLARFKQRGEMGF